MKWIRALLVVVVLVMCTASLLVGRGSLSDAGQRGIFLRLRAYRVAGAFIAGAALAASGVVVQALFRNPLCDSFVIGTIPGAVLGGQVTMLAFYLLRGRLHLLRVVPEMFVPIGSLAGAIVSLVALFAVVRRGRGPLVVLLSGFILSSLFVAVGSLLTALAQDSWDLARALLAFSQGSVSSVGPRQLRMALPLAGAALIAVRLWSAPLDLLLSGESEAHALGLDVAAAQRWSIVWVGLLTTAAVVVGGHLAFVGLIVPHALRPFTGVLGQRLLPAAVLAGGGFVVACDLCARALPMQSEMPLGVLTSLIGAPLFLTLLFRTYGEVQHG